jgi:hypothetical protein
MLPPPPLLSLLRKLCSPHLLHAVALPHQSAWFFPLPRTIGSASGASHRNIVLETTAARSGALHVVATAIRRKDVSSLL